MPTNFALTRAVKETGHQISVIIVTESPQGRTLIGGLGGTFVAAEIEVCTREEFISHLPANTADYVMALTAGTYTFDAEQGTWN